MSLFSTPQSFKPVKIVIASPPCPTFSRAGLRAGIEDLALIYEAAEALAEDRMPSEVAWKDQRSALVLEPLRWTLALRPRWLAWEQVPDVLPFWEVCAEHLRGRGWNAWTGILRAEQYGVPQTRERAILMADLDAEVHPPLPTHQRYVKGTPAMEEFTIDGPVAPWISMGDALGWERDVVGDRGDEPAGGNEFTADRPSWTVTEKARSWVWERPAPTLVTTRRSRDGIIVGRQLPSGEGENVGGHGWDSDAAESKPKSEGDAVRVTLEEAATLQTFSADYPFQGSRSKRFEQVGNAVPPLLAEAVLRSLLQL